MKYFAIACMASICSAVSLGTEEDYSGPYASCSFLFNQEHEGDVPEDIKPMFTARKVDESDVQYDFAIEDGDNNQGYQLYIARAYDGYEANLDQETCDVDGYGYVSWNLVFSKKTELTSPNLERQTLIDDFLNIDQLTDGSAYAIMFDGGDKVACCTLNKHFNRARYNIQISAMDSVTD